MTRRHRTEFDGLAVDAFSILTKMIPELREDLIIFGRCSVYLENGVITRADPSKVRITI
jgi:hypothetical protein